jgi:glycine/D-amino acid oxidase-like deaminating enzyme
MTPALLLPKLKQELTAVGVRFIERRFASVADVASLDESVVVNCTGYGARALWGDATVIPQRGHNVVLQKTNERQHYFFSGGCDNDVIAYVFCRQNDIVIGGTIQPQRDDVALGVNDDAIFRRLLANAAGLFAGDVAGCVRT